jgi:hypothetical protein
VIVVTDNLVPFPCIPWQIQGNNVDYVVEVDSIGDPSKIVSGTTRITKSPDRLLIAELVASFIRDSGHHARRLLLPGRRRRHRAGLRRLSGEMMREPPASRRASCAAARRSTSSRCSKRA